MRKIKNDAAAVLTEVHSAAEQRNYTGSFCGFVLLDAMQYDLLALEQRLKQRWGIEPITEPIGAGMDEITIEGGQEGDWLEAFLAEESEAILTEDVLPQGSAVRDGNLVFDIPGAMVIISLVQAPVPDGEAAQNAGNNYDWPEAVGVAQNHVAHLVIGVLPQDLAPVEAGKTFVKIISSCLEAEQAVGVYTSGTVLSPVAYQQTVTAMEQGELPIANWIYFGRYQNEAGNHGFTIGLDSFGKDELEILNSQHTLEEIQALLFTVVRHVLTTDAVLKSSEAIDGQQLSMKRGDGVAVEGHSIQIAY